MTEPQVFPSDQSVDYTPLSATKRFGLIALATDLTSERDFNRIMPIDKAGVYAARIAYENPTTPDNLRKMKPRIRTAAGLILPGIGLDAICYSCTAASVVIGDEEIAAAIHEARPGVPVVTPTAAGRLALSVLGVSRIAVLAPYLVETSKPVAAYFRRHGFSVMRFECFGIDDDRDMARLTRDTIVEAVLRLDAPDVEAFFISCTALPAIDAIAEIEARTGKFAVTSNQASAWAMMRHAGLDERRQSYGRLFNFPLPSPPEKVVA